MQYFRQKRKGVVRIIGVPLLSLFLFVISGCAVPVLMEPTVLIQNRTNKTIQQMVYRVCGSESVEWEPLNQVVPFRANTDIIIDLPVECVDLRAFYADGKVAGTQQSVKKKFPFRWTLR